MNPKDAKRQLAKMRGAFRARMEGAQAISVWKAFSGRIGAVLSGGGARGAYEAGVLLAFQDSQLPTHIITATSIGSINAASYAAHSDDLVGNAEPQVESWFALTPLSVGVEWTRYLWMLIGLVSAAAGFGNLVLYALEVKGFSIHLHTQALTWFSLGLAGAAVLLFHDSLPYLFYVIRNSLGQGSWKPEPLKIALSLVANFVVAFFLVQVIRSLHLHSRLLEVVRVNPVPAALVAGGLGLLEGLRRLYRTRVSLFAHRLLRLPLGIGLFANFERTRLLRNRIPAERLHASPIHLLFTATDLDIGTARLFSNHSPEEIAAALGANPDFVAREITLAEDTIVAVVASSALPMVFEPVRITGHLYTDGGVTGNQPIRPAIRLGADVLFLVLTQAPGGGTTEIKTFLDSGLRALEILMAQNLLADLKTMASVNTFCEQAAAGRGLPPEQVECEVSGKRYRYVKTFTICPRPPLNAGRLDFTPEEIVPAVLQGYRDAGAEIENFLNYARVARFGSSRQVISFAPEHVANDSKGPNIL